MRVTRACVRTFGSIVLAGMVGGASIGCGQAATDDALYATVPDKLVTLNIHGVNKVTTTDVGTTGAFGCASLARSAAGVMYSVCGPGIAKPGEPQQLATIDLKTGRATLFGQSVVGLAVRAVGLYLASNDYYQRALQHGDPKPDAATREAILTEVGLNYLDVNDGHLGAQTFEKCLREFPQSQRTAEWTKNLGRARTLAQSQDQARKYLEEALRRFPIDGPH